MASTRSPGSRSSVLPLLLASLLVLPPGAAGDGAAGPLATSGAQATLPLSPFPAIHSPNLPDYALYQVKFTYLGDQKKSVSTLAAVGMGRMYDLAAFTPYERGLDYGNDEFTGDTLLLTEPELMGFVNAIAAFPALTDTSFVAEPNMSLMILRDLGPAEVCWEHLATRGETDTLFQLLRDQVLNPADTLTVSNFRRQMAGVRR
jgi:hypothetical protein